jgi:hypothetical protein
MAGSMAEPAGAVKRGGKRRPAVSAEPQLADRLALRQLVEDYARGCDRRESLAVAGLFTEDGRLVQHREGAEADPPASDTRGRAAIAELIEGLGRFEVTTHFLGQQSLTFDGDTAQGETYCLAHHLYRRDGERRNRVMSIRYLDRYRREGPGWRFTERRLAVDWVEDRPLRPDRDQR